ncbi:MAG: hypothetical protein EP335_12490 [Alphaproteobacteria bacterium]|nr:MAG: hypothetical protein EP335_12490 [Alphaproteobacteria bacterium]
MKKFLFSAAALLFAAIPATAQDQADAPAEAAPPETVIQLPFDIELKRPMTVDVTYTYEKAGASIEARERIRLTALKKAEDHMVFSAVSEGGSLEKAEGLPPYLQGTLEKITADMGGLSYEYKTDLSGFPSELTKAKDVRKFVAKLGKAMEKWAGKFGKEQKLSADQIAQVQGFAKAWVEPFLADDPAELSRLILDGGQLMFFGTGRELYVNYFTLSQSTRYFEPGKAWFEVTEEWEVTELDEEAGRATLYFRQSLSPEKYQAFLGRLRDMLVKQNGADRQKEIDAYVANYEALQLNREGEYVMDLKTGLPLSGHVIEEQVFQGQRELESMRFALAY